MQQACQCTLQDLWRLRRRPHGDGATNLSLLLLSIQTHLRPILLVQQWLLQRRIHLAQLLLPCLRRQCQSSSSRRTTLSQRHRRPGLPRLQWQWTKPLIYVCAKFAANKLMLVVASATTSAVSLEIALTRFIFSFVVLFGNFSFHVIQEFNI